MVLKKQIDNYESVTSALLKCVKILEDKLMESNIIMHGIKESAWKPEDTCRELVLKAIADTINVDDPEEKVNTARKIPIKSINRVGRYSAMHHDQSTLALLVRVMRIYYWNAKSHLKRVSILTENIVMKMRLSGRS